MTYIAEPCYIHVSINYRAPVDYRAVEGALGMDSLDWLRYAPNSYILWTRSDPAVIAGRLMTIDGMKDCYFFICKLDFSKGFGWLPEFLWHWIHQDRHAQPELPFSFPLLPPPPPKR